MTGRKSELPCWGVVVVVLLWVVLSWRRGDEGALHCKRWLESPHDRDHPPWVRLPTASTRPASSSHITQPASRTRQGSDTSEARLTSSNQWQRRGSWEGEALLNLGQSEMTLNVCSSQPVALGFDWGSMSEKRPTQVERWLDRHKNKPLFPCLVYLGKAAKIFCIWTVCDNVHNVPKCGAQENICNMSFTLRYYALL